MKKVLLYAIVPAIIAGLFALIPKVYDEMNEPKASLEYSIFQGPLLKAGDQYKTIVSIEVENTGKKVLSNAVAIIESYADIESKSLTSSMGFEPELTGNGVIKVVAGKMHPSDKFTLSLMLSSNTNILPPKIALRADEVVGSVKSSKKDNSKNVSFFSSLLSGMSVFVMSAYFIVKSRFGTTLPNILSKQDNLFYIAAKVGKKDLIDSVFEQGGNVTYLRFSDILFYLGQSGKLTKQDAINGLECLLLVDEIAASSRKHIERNLKVLSDYEPDAEHFAKLKEKSKSIKSSFELRNAIDSHIDLAEVF